MTFQCQDDPATLLAKDWCLSAVSKDLLGTLSLLDNKPHACHTPPCKTQKTVQALKLKAATHAPCDSDIAKKLDGALVVARLVTVFDQDNLHRGFHSGDFVWAGAAGIQVTGRLSGITNVGTHRLPAFGDCQKCDDKGVMEGRLCGQIASTSNPALNGCQVEACYRIRFNPGSAGAPGGQGDVKGTLEGVIVCVCVA